MDTSLTRPLSREQKLRPLCELLATLQDKYGRDPDPLTTLIVLSMGHDPTAPEGTEAFVPTNIQLEAAKAAVPYVRPKLANVQVTGADEGPLRVSHSVMKLVGTDERLLALADEFAINLATQQSIETSEEDTK